MQTNPATRKKAAIGVLAVFFTQFVSFLFINARNIAIPVIVDELDGLAYFSWLIAMPALTGSASTLLFGKLSDIFGRRAMLVVSIGLFIAGLALAASSTSMIFLVAASGFMSIGHFPIVPLCFSAIGDLFPPAERARWTGLLNLPGGIAAAVGPFLGGVVAQSGLGWRALYWGTIPLMLLAGGLAVAGMPGFTHKGRPKIDGWGTLVVLVAIASMIFGVTRLGEPGQVPLGAALLAVSAAAWVIFLRIEKRAEAPILDPQVLYNRTFLTAAAASLLACFGIVTLTSYTPVFVQAVMGLNPALNGSIQTPYTMLVAFMGIPTGLILARARKYKWMYNTGYALVTVALLALWQFQALTPVWLYLLVTALAGLGVGAIRTINTLVAQFAVPARLLGAAVGAMFFSQMIGLSVTPAILGLVQNGAPDVASGLKQVFLLGAITMAAALLLITTIPEAALEDEAPAGQIQPAD